jgi:hypothetical protein
MCVCVCVCVCVGGWIFIMCECFGNMYTLIYCVLYFDMDMSYARVLHIKVAYRVPHKGRHAFYVTRPLLRARITCYVTVITHGRCYARA